MQRDQANHEKDEMLKQLKEIEKSNTNKSGVLVIKKAYEDLQKVHKEDSKKFQDQQRELEAAQNQI